MTTIAGIFLLPNGTFFIELIVSLVLHMFSTMLLKAYRTPRELTWVTGFALFAIALGFGFSGYLLPWNELAFFATAGGTDSVKAVPGVGEWLMQVLRGGPDVSGNTPRSAN